MQKIITWLGNHRLLNILLALAFFLAVVALHEAVTVLAIKLRRQLSIEGYNLFFTGITAVLFMIWFGWLIRKVMQNREYKTFLMFFLPTLLLVVLFFLFMLTYSIEAVHFFQYALLAMLLFPLLKTYGGSVFWATLLGILDEIYQYVILTPAFKYFDLNDILLNLLGAGLAAVTIYLSTGIRTKSRDSWKQIKISAAIIILLAVFYIIGYYSGLVRWYPLPGEADVAWFTISRSGPEASFWTLAYKGNYFHIIRPWEGIGLMVILFAAYFRLDLKV